MANYFHKNWENSNFINFNSLDDSKIKYRTNNQVELFHRSLNQLIENGHPKISYLLEKLKLLIVNKYNDYLIYDNKINDEKVNKYDLFQYIYNFTVEFNKKYNINFDFKLLIQVENNLKDDSKKICDDILEEIFDISFNENDIEEEEEDEKNENFEGEEKRNQSEDSIIAENSIAY